jgi:uncharacterized delta-60 repeat protein
MLAVLAGLLLLPLQLGALGAGDLDSSFGGDGIVTTNFETNDDESSHDNAYALALQPDGKIVVAGSSGFDNTDDSRFALARYLPNGTLDPTFGDQGRVRTDFNGGGGDYDVYDFAFALILQPDGKIVAAGVSYGTTGGFALARYLPNGTLDPSFGNQGTVVTDFTGPAYALALQPDGKIVAAGGAFSIFTLARYLPNGALDPSFGTQGRVTTDFGSGRVGGAQALTLQPDGKIVVAGSPTDASGQIDIALLRYRSNGSLDPTFGSQGIVRTHIGSGRNDAAQALTLQPDGKIVVAGSSADASGQVDIALLRYRSNGSLDPTFGSQGTVRTRLGIFASAFALEIQPYDGRVVVAGWAYFPLPNGSWDFALARYHAITCHGVVVTQIGTTGNDTSIGTPGPDVIFGFGGDDTISGRGGNDLLCGGSGNDTLYGGGGDDILSGGSGMDTCAGGGQVSGDQAVECEQVTNVP